MRKIIEYTLLSIDGVFDRHTAGFMEYRDDAYLRDGLGLLAACDAMLMGRRTYENFAKIWPARVGAHPWAERLNFIKKYSVYCLRQGASSSGADRADSLGGV